MTFITIPTKFSIRETFKSCYSGSTLLLHFILQTPDIDLWTVLSAGDEQLWGRVLRTPAVRLEEAPRGLRVTQSKIWGEMICWRLSQKKSLIFTEEIFEDFVVS